jgi:hypothetical protein
VTRVAQRKGVTQRLLKEVVTKGVTQGIAQRIGVTQGIAQRIGDKGCYSRNCSKNW